MTDPIDTAFHAFAEYVHQIDGVLHLSIQGLTQITRSVEMVEALMKYEEVSEERLSPEEENKRLERAKEQAAFAQAEMEKGFPVVHAHAVVGLWEPWRCSFRMRPLLACVCVQSCCDQRPSRRLGYRLPNMEPWMRKRDFAFLFPSWSEGLGRI